MVRQVAVGLLNFALFVGAAGTLAWPRGWAFIGLITGLSTAVSIWLWRFDKGLFAERAASPFRGGQRPRDRRIASAIYLVTLLWFLAMPLDAVRFHGSRAPLWTAPVGAALVTACFAGLVWVMRENRFA